MKNLKTLNLPLETAGQRLAACRKSIGKTLQSVADEITALGDVTLQRATLNNYEHDRHFPQIKIATALCNYYGITIQWLSTGMANFTADNHHEYPLLTVEQILRAEYQTKTFQQDTYFYANQKYRDNSFWITVTGDAMHPILTEGVNALCEPITTDTPPQSNNIVLVHIDDNIIIREYKQDGTRIILQPVNKHYKIETLTENYTIIAILREYHGIIK